MLKQSYLDYRKKMKRAGWSIGTRPGTRYFSIHYNGPSVKGFGNATAEIAQLQFDSGYHMRADTLAADGIQYHGATLSNGWNVQLREWYARLWHCGNAEGNNYSIAWHLPIGGTQKPTQVQIHNLFNVVIPDFMQHYGIQVINIKGHKEWKRTLCPGEAMRILLDWREDHLQAPIVSYYRTLTDVFVRESPEIKPNRANVALNGTALVPRDTVFAVDRLVRGVPYLDEDMYVHRLDGLGFILAHKTLLKLVS